MAQLCRPQPCASAPQHSSCSRGGGPVRETGPPQQPEPPAGPGFLLSLVVGSPGLQDPLDQATLLEQLGTGGSSQVSRQQAPSTHPRAEWAQQAARGHVSPELPVGTPGIRAQPCGPHHGPRQVLPSAIHKGTHVPPSPPPLGRCLLPAASRWPSPCFPCSGRRPLAWDCPAAST